MVNNTILVTKFILNFLINLILNFFINFVLTFTLNFLPKKWSNFFLLRKHRNEPKKKQGKKKDRSVSRHEETSVVWKDNHFHCTCNLMTSWYVQMKQAVFVGCSKRNAPQSIYEKEKRTIWKKTLYLIQHE